MKDQGSREKDLPMSVIIPEAAPPEKIRLLLDSLLKIRKPLSKNYEIVLFTEQTASVKKQVREIIGSETPIEQGIFRVHESKGSTGNNLSSGISDSKHGNILILDLKTLERSFNFDELFRIDQDVVTRANAVLPCFREQSGILSPGDPHPMILLSSELASYLLTDLPVRDDDPFSEIIYRISGLGINVETYSVSQVNPFGTLQQSFKYGAGIQRKAGSFYDWFFRVPLAEISSGLNKKYSFLKVPGYFRTLFVCTAIIIAFILPILSLGAGLSGDDEKHYEHARKVYNYYATGGNDKSALTDPALKLNYYGQSYDLLTYVVNKIFNIEAEYESRHFLIAIIGFLAILYAGLVAVLLAGYRAGFLTLLLMFFAPRFVGHSFNNPMDIPFAFGYIFTIYHTFRFLRNLPAFSIRSSIMITLGIAFTISIRIGGLMLIPYIFMFAGLYVWFRKRETRRFSPDWFRMVRKGTVFLVAISVSAYVLSLIPWPYGLQNPIKNPFESLSVMSNISVAIRVLFDGNIHWSNRLPWYYISMNILYTVPVLLLAGFILNAFLFPLYRKRIQPIFIFFLYFVVIFPVAYVVYKESNVYGGWRHLLFVFPSMAVLSAISLDSLIRNFRARYLKLALALVIAAGFIHPGLHILRNHPFEYIYFNEIMGIDRAYGRFETDYYLNSLKQGTEWLIDNVLEEKETDDTLRIATNATIGYYLRHHTHLARPVYTRYYDRAAFDWDYAVYFCNYIDPYQLKNGLWPPYGTIHTVNVGNAPICAVVKRETKKDYEAIQQYQQRNLINAIPMLEEVNREYPNGEYVKLRLAEAYIQVGEFEKAHAMVNECLEIYPDYDKALNIRGIAYLQAHELQQAISTFLQVTRINYRFAAAYHNLGLAYIRQNDAETALRYFQKAIDVNFRYRPSYEAIGQILMEMGRTQEAQQYLEAAATL